MNQEELGAAEIQADVIIALMERAEAMDEDWRVWATFQIVVEYLRNEVNDAADSEEETRFTWATELLSEILTLMLYLTTVSSEEEINAEVEKWRGILSSPLFNGDEEAEE